MELDLAAFANKEIADCRLKMKDLTQDASIVYSESSKTKAANLDDTETSLESLLMFVNDSCAQVRELPTKITFHMFSSIKKEGKSSLSTEASPL